MSKPLPSHIEYGLSCSTIILNECLSARGSEGEIVLGEPTAETAAVLFALGLEILKRNPESLKRILLEAGLLEELPLRGSSYDLRVKGLRDNKDNKGLRGQPDQQLVVDSLSEEEGKEEQQPQPSDGQSSLPVNRFAPKAQNESPAATRIKPETERVLLASGISINIIRYFNTLNGYINALNNNKVNPAKAAATMIGKEGFSARYQSWLQKNPGTVAEKSPAYDLED